MHSNWSPANEVTEPHFTILLVELGLGNNIQGYELDADLLLHVCQALNKYSSLTHVVVNVSLYL